jgi:probable F420-dependent oxidoreductase
MAVRIGIGLFTGQIPAGSDRTFAQEYRETVELVRLAEAVGFDSAWVSEHHGSSDGYLPSLLVMLAAFAEATSRVRLGTGLILTPFHDPLRLAEDAAVVDQISGGRLVLGLGLAWREEEFRMFGVPFVERRQRTVETVEILRRAWTGERFSFHGRIFDHDRVRVTPPTAQPGGPPILLGGHADPAIRRAGEIADGHVNNAEDLHSVRKAVSLMEEGARAAGRDPSVLQLTLMQNAFVAEERTDAWALVRDGVMHQWGAYDAWDEGHDTPEHDSLEPGAIDEDAARRSTPTGTPEEVAHALRPAVEAFGGRREFELIVRLHYPGMAFDPAARAIELFGEQVIPALKGS